MNRQRRKDLKSVIENLEVLHDTIEEISECLQNIRDEEEEAFENLPESLQESERGQQMQEYIDTMESVIDLLNEFDSAELIDPIEEIANS